jgi:hypothetical protein
MGSDLHRAYLTRLRCALRFFQPLSALIPPASVAALFHAASARRIPPFRAFPLLKAVTPFDARCPPGITSRFQLRSPRQAAPYAPFPLLLPSGLYSSSRCVHTMPEVNPNTAAIALLGFVPSKGLPGVSSLVTLHISLESAPPWLIVSPRMPEYVTASWHIFFGPCSPLPE